MFTIIRSFSNQPYLYDSGTNEFYALDEQSCATLEQADGKVSGCADETLRNQLIDGGINDDQLTVISIDGFIAAFHKLISEESAAALFGKLTFGMTERCNLRCKYCIYSGEYESERTHATEGRDLSLETADKTLNHYMRKAQKPEFVIFYGGEALLNFPVLQHIVERVKRESPGTRFSITTNAILLSDKGKLDYLLDNGFMLNISFDGPQQQTARVDCAGNGTYERVYGILQSIYDRDAVYFNSHVMLNIVITPMHSLLEIKRYFDETPIFANCTLSPIFAYDPDSIYVKKYCLEQQQQLNIAELAELRAEFAKDYRQASPFLKGIYLQQMQQLNQRGMGRPDYLALHSCCLPGYGNMFVNSEGKLNMCERAERIVLGTVDDFSSIEQQATKALETYRALVEKYCCGCWANRICSRCFATIDRGDISEAAFVSDCDRLRENYARQLQIFLTIKEQDENALDELDGQGVDYNEQVRDFTM
ncbi:MAG: radical SAM protein [Bacillota bacterium]